MAPALAKDVVPGPIPAEVLRVVDGDTLDVRAQIWLGMIMEIRVRVNGVNTPEMKGKCPEEKAMALLAKEFVIEKTSAGVVLQNIQYGKWAGRVVADVIVRNQNLAAQLIAVKLGRAYKGGKRLSWCDEPT